MDGRAFVNRLVALAAMSSSMTAIYLLHPVVERERAFEDGRAGFVQGVIETKAGKPFRSQYTGETHMTYTVSYRYSVGGEDYSGEAWCNDCPQLASVAEGQELRLRYDMDAPGSTRVDGIDRGVGIVGRFVSGLYGILLAAFVMLLLGRLGNFKRLLRAD